MEIKGENLFSTTVLTPVITERFPGADQRLPTGQFRYRVRQEAPVKACAGLTGTMFQRPQSSRTVKTVNPESEASFMVIRCEVAH